MSQTKRSIFRNQALEHYVRSREQEILPRIIAPPVFLCLWALLTLCIAASIVTWLYEIPVYVSGAGVVLKSNTTQGTLVVHEAVALVFLPTNPTHPLHVYAGMPVRLQIGTLEQQVSTSIETVTSGVLSPDEARQRYGLGDEAAQLITGPSIAVTVKLDSLFQTQVYTKSNVNAQVQIGSKRVLSLLPGLGNLIGD